MGYTLPYGLLPDVVEVRLVLNWLEKLERLVPSSD